MAGSAEHVSDVVHQLIMRSNDRASRRGDQARLSAAWIHTMLAHHERAKGRCDVIELSTKRAANLYGWGTSRRELGYVQSYFELALAHPEIFPHWDVTRVHIEGGRRARSKLLLRFSRKARGAGAA